MLLRKLIWTNVKNISIPTFVKFIEFEYETCMMGK